MTYRTRQRIAAVVSLFLMVFSICQAQARAALVPAPVPATGAAMEMADCHQGDRAGDASAVDCHGTCTHLQQHKDAAQKLPLPDVTPLLLTFLQPFAQPLAGFAVADGYRPPDPFSTDPPASIRFQRFLN